MQLENDKFIDYLIHSFIFWNFFFFFILLWFYCSMYMQHVRAFDLTKTKSDDNARREGNQMVWLVRGTSAEIQRMKFRNCWWADSCFAILPLRRCTRQYLTTSHGWCWYKLWTSLHLLYTSSIGLSVILYAINFEPEIPDLAGSLTDDQRIVGFTLSHLQV